MFMSTKAWRPRQRINVFPSWWLAGISQKMQPEPWETCSIKARRQGAQSCFMRLPSVAVRRGAPQPARPAPPIAPLWDEAPRADRSEERRVGKECRTWGGAYHENQQTTE